MALYYYLIDAGRFHGPVRSALGESWRRRSFVPLRPLWIDLLPQAEVFREHYRLGPDDLLLPRAGGMPFDREGWRCLAGEVFLLAAAELPEMDDAREGLIGLLAPDLSSPRPVRRSDLHPVEQAHCGSREVILGGAFYRPDHAGYNDLDDVARLAGYLRQIDPAAWDAHALEAEEAEERSEELEYLRQSFLALRGLYERALAARQVILCETLG